MTLADFFVGFQAHANEAKLGRFITSEEAIWMINHAEMLLALETRYNIETYDYSIGSAIVALSTNHKWFNFPSNFLSPGDIPLGMIGDDLTVRVFEETIDNWTSRQLRRDNDLYASADPLATIDSSVVIYTRYPIGNRKIITRFDKSQRMAGYSGEIFAIEPDIVLGDLLQVSFVGRPPLHSVGGISGVGASNLYAPDKYIEPLMRKCLSVLKYKDGEYDLSKVEDSEFLGKANRVKQQTKTGRRRNRKFVSADEVNGLYRHPWCD